MQDDAKKQEGRDGSPATSWLVRCWIEPGEGREGEPVFRCRLRDLRTGEERYLSDPRQIGELMYNKLKLSRKAFDGLKRLRGGE
jgi:hypothetical protein